MQLASARIRCDARIRSGMSLNVMGQRSRCCAREFVYHLKKDADTIASALFRPVFISLPGEPHSDTL